MSSKADKLGAGASFSQARRVSARRAAIDAATDAPTAGVPDPTELPVGVISQNPDNPRDKLRDLDAMTQTIRELGVINTITVARVDAYLRERPERADDLDDGAKYIVVDGHRRLEGARRAGLKSIKVMVDDTRVATDEALLEAAFVANFHRDNLTELEEAHALDALVKFYGNQTKASKRLGIPQPTISSKLSLLKLSPELQADLASGRRLVEHVRNLGKLTPEEQRAAADARAAAAKERVENERASLSGGTPLVPESDEDYHGVIIPDGAGEQAPPTTDASAESAGDSTRSTEPAPSQVRKRASHDGTPVHAVPWGDPHTVVRIAQEQMTSENFRIAAKLWQQLTEK